MDRFSFLSYEEKNLIREALINYLTVVKNRISSDTKDKLSIEVSNSSKKDLELLKNFISELN